MVFLFFFPSEADLLDFGFEFLLLFLFEGEEVLEGGGVDFDLVEVFDLFLEGFFFGVEGLDFFGFGDEGFG